MVDAVGAVSELRQHAMEYAPSRQPQPVPTHEGHCVKCKGKKTFEIAEETKMKNGALMRKGACPDCGTTVVAFAKGVADATA